MHRVLGDKSGKEVLENVHAGPEGSHTQSAQSQVPPVVGAFKSAKLQLLAQGHWVWKLLSQIQGR